MATIIDRAPVEERIIRRLGIGYEEVGIALLSNGDECCFVARINLEERVPLDREQVNLLLNTLWDINNDDETTFVEAI